MMAGWLDGWLAGWMDGWMDVCKMCVFLHNDSISVQEIKVTGIQYTADKYENGVCTKN